MDINPLSSRKLATRLPSREGNPSQQNPSSISSAQDKFFRKSGKAFHSVSSIANHGIIKSDLLQIIQKFWNVYYKNRKDKESLIKKIRT